jgi:hypothetical protein
LLDIILRLLRQPRKFRLNLLAPLFDLLAALNKRWRKVLAASARDRTANRAASPSSRENDDTHTRRVEDLAAKLEAVWNCPDADIRLKKRIVRTLIHEVVVDVDPSAR